MAGADSRGETVGIESLRARFKCSKKTINRDIDALIDLGIPIAKERESGLSVYYRLTVDDFMEWFLDEA